MTFDPQQFIEDVRFMKRRYEVCGSRYAYKDDLDLVPIDWDDPSDFGEETPPLGAVAVSPEEFEAIKAYLFGSPSGLYPRDLQERDIRPQRNLNNPRQFRLNGIRIQIVNAQTLFLEHLDPDSIAAKFTGIDETVYYHNSSPI